MVSVIENRTRKILENAERGGYAVGAINCYNDDAIIAVVQAAEATRSPAIIQLFPWTMKFQGPHFVRYAAEAAHAASVPISLHLDHCIEPEDVESALDLPFDSIMIDASRLEGEENISECSRIVQKAKLKGISIEAEMGRIEGGEDGLPDTDMEGVLTDPAHVADFVQRTGVDYIAPAIGNIHGSYGPEGPEKFWRLPLLEEIHQAIPNIPLVLHGTFGASDELLLETVSRGVRKINLNKQMRDRYVKFIAENVETLDLTAMKEKATEVFRDAVIESFNALGSSGKA